MVGDPLDVVFVHPDRNEVDERAVLADDADSAVAGTGDSMAVLMVDRSKDERSVCPATGGRVDEISNALGGEAAHGTRSLLPSVIGTFGPVGVPNARDSCLPVRYRGRVSEGCVSNSSTTKRSSARGVRAMLEAQPDITVVGEAGSVEGRRSAAWVSTIPTSWSWMSVSPTGTGSRPAADSLAVAEGQRC